jgi:sphingolipid delta-4 desaturase
MSSAKYFSGRCYSFFSFSANRLTPNSTFQILFYALRPGFVRSQKPTYWHFIGIVTQLSLDFLLATFVPGGKYMVIYFIMSSFWAGSLHPLAGHFIAEHYVWDNLQQETYSYYGWLNIFAYNVSGLSFNGLGVE